MRINRQLTGHKERIQMKQRLKRLEERADKFSEEAIPLFVGALVCAWLLIGVFGIIRTVLALVSGAL